MSNLNNKNLNFGSIHEFTNRSNGTVIIKAGDREDLELKGSININGEFTINGSEITSGTATNLSQLNDVTISGAATNDTLYHANDGKWKNRPNTFQNLSNVTLTTPVNNDHLIYSGGSIINQANTLQNLTDTTILNKLDKQVLSYDATTFKWNNHTLTTNDISNINLTLPLVAGQSLCVKNDLTGFENKDITPNTISEMSDYTGTATNGQYMKFNGTSWSGADLPALSSTLDGLTDVSISTVQGSETILWNTVTNLFENRKVELNDINNVQITGAVQGDVLMYNNGTSTWTNQNVPYPVNLADLTDTSISAVTQGQVLTYTNGLWKNQNLPTIDLSLEDLNNVSGVAVNNNYLKYNGSSWVPSNIPTSATSLDNLTDVSISTPLENQLLVYKHIPVTSNYEWSNEYVTPTDLYGVDDLAPLGLNHNHVLTAQYNAFLGTYDYSWKDPISASTSTFKAPINNNINLTPIIGFGFFVYNATSAQYDVKQLEMKDILYANIDPTTSNSNRYVTQVKVGTGYEWRNTTININTDIENVDVADVDDKDIMQYNGTSLKWRGVTINNALQQGNLQALGDVEAGAVNGDTLKYNGTDWIPEPLAFGSLADTGPSFGTISTTTTNQFITWAKQVPGTNYRWDVVDCGQALTDAGVKLDHLVDCQIGAESLGQTLVYNGTLFQNDNLKIGYLDEVAQTGALVEKEIFITDNGGNLVNRQLDINDTTFSGASEGIVKFDGTSVYTTANLEDEIVKVPRMYPNKWIETPLNDNYYTLSAGITKLGTRIYVTNDSTQFYITRCTENEKFIPDNYYKLNGFGSYSYVSSNVYSENTTEYNNFTYFIIDAFMIYSLDDGITWSSFETVPTLGIAYHRTGNFFAIFSVGASISEIYVIKDIFNFNNPDYLMTIPINDEVDLVDFLEPKYVPELDAIYCIGLADVRRSLYRVTDINTCEYVAGSNFAGYGDSLYKFYFMNNRFFLTNGIDIGYFAMSSEFYTYTATITSFEEVDIIDDYILYQFYVYDNIAYAVGRIDNAYDLLYSFNFIKWYRLGPTSYGFTPRVPGLDGYEKVLGDNKYVTCSIYDASANEFIITVDTSAIYSNNSFTLDASGNIIMKTQKIGDILGKPSDNSTIEFNDNIWKYKEVAKYFNIAKYTNELELRNYETPVSMTIVRSAYDKDYLYLMRDASLSSIRRLNYNFDSTTIAIGTPSIVYSAPNYKGCFNFLNNILVTGNKCNYLNLSFNQGNNWTVRTSGPNLDIWNEKSVCSDNNNLYVFGTGASPNLVITKDLFKNTWATRTCASDTGFKIGVHDHNYNNMFLYTIDTTETAKTVGQCAYLSVINYTTANFVVNGTYNSENFIKFTTHSSPFTVSGANNLLWDDDYKKFIHLGDNGVVYNISPSGALPSNTLSFTTNYFAGVNFKDTVYNEVNKLYIGTDHSNNLLYASNDGFISLTTRTFPTYTSTKCLLFDIFNNRTVFNKTNGSGTNSIIAELKDTRQTTLGTGLTDLTIRAATLNIDANLINLGSHHTKLKISDLIFPERKDITLSAKNHSMNPATNMIIDFIVPSRDGFRTPDFGTTFNNTYSAYWTDDNANLAWTTAAFGRRMVYVCSADRGVYNINFKGISGNTNGQGFISITGSNPMVSGSNGVVSYSYFQAANSATNAVSISHNIYLCDSYVVFGGNNIKLNSPNNETTVSMTRISY